jgi:hypothetical protein
MANRAACAMSSIARDGSAAMDQRNGIADTLRATWKQLIGQDLPEAAARAGWPLRDPEAFERILLDRVLGEGWAGPADDLDLILAVELGGRVLEGKVCPVALDRESRTKREAAAADLMARILARRGRPQGS